MDTYAADVAELVAALDLKDAIHIGHSTGGGEGTHEKEGEQVMVLGESRPFLVALAVLNREAWTGLAAQLGLDPAAPEAVHDTRVEQFVLQRLDGPLSAFPSYARVRRAWLTLDAWTVDDGLVTPTLKVRRRQVEQRFADAIGRLYERPPEGGREAGR